MEDIIKISAQVSELHFAEDLPNELEGFTLRKISEAQEDKFLFFVYVDDEIHCAVTIYYHDETKEFKVRQRIGLTEFCLTNFFTEDASRFKTLLDTELDGVLKNLRNVRNKPNRFLQDLKLDEWTYGSNLPAQLEGFTLFIKPAAPVEVTNGSHVVLNYVDFDLSSDFVLYYNIYTDEFSGERRINGATHVTYAFDANALSELEGKLETNLVDELRTIRRLSTEGI